MAARSRRARPLASMTGYGRGRATNRWAEAEVELRSVNGKSLHLSMRLPPERLEWEAEVEEHLRQRFERGSLQGTVRLRGRQTAPATLDRAALQRHAKEWKAAQRELALGGEPPALSDLMALPGVWRPGEELSGALAGARKAMLAALAAATDELQAAREREGGRLARELTALAAELAAGLVKVKARLPRARAAAETRLKERIGRAMEAAGAGPMPDLGREIVLAAEKADVEEECARLEIHLGRLSELLVTGGPCGRELEFLLQECQREVTTLGNKVGDAELSAISVTMKLAVQRLREQVANVE